MSSLVLGASGRPTKPLVRFTHVEKRYRARFSMRIDDLTLCEGDHLLVVGANGSGKSTFLRALAGALAVSSGTLWRAPEWRHLRVAYVPQAGGLYGELTVADNLRLRRALYSRPRPAEASDGSHVARTEEFVAQRLGLESVLGTRVRALSGGMHRLASLAAALHSDPQVFIVDEPFGDLDDRGFAAVEAVLAEVLPQLRLFVCAMPTGAPDLPVNRHLRMEEGRTS